MSTQRLCATDGEEVGVGRVSEFLVVRGNAKKLFVSSIGVRFTNSLDGKGKKSLAIHRSATHKFLIFSEKNQASGLDLGRIIGRIV